MTEYLNIDYDSFLDDQPSNYPFRIIRYNYNNNCGMLKFYKKQKEYNYSSNVIESYIRNKFSKLIKKITIISDKFIGDERIVNYTVGEQVLEIHFDREDKEYYFTDTQIISYLNN